LAKQRKKNTKVFKVKKTPATPRKRFSRKSKQPSYIKKNVFAVLGSILLISLVFIGYFLGQNNNSRVAYPERKTQSYTSKDLIDDLSRVKKAKLSYLSKEDKSAKVNKKQEVIEVSSSIGANKQKINSIEIKEKVQKKEIKQDKALVQNIKKPKLAIIIDDIYSLAQMKKIKTLGMKITPSIFPPSRSNMSSHKLADGSKHYMVHIPLQSSSGKLNKHYKTLMVGDSERKMITRAKELRELFPRAKYVNNHTGSVFTDNYSAMYRLYSALRNEGFVFVDSLTIGSSKVREIAKEFADPYRRRDIFLDNKQERSYIHKQLRVAVKKAKKQGYAVAIGHPYTATIEALSSSKHILKDVELVYIDEIYK